MRRYLAALILAFGSLPAWTADEDIVFRSDVALVRVDAQVVDGTNRAVTGLTAQDFLLYEQGKEQPIRNFARENLPVDVVFLLDVSGSMRPHVQRIASAAHEALRVLGPNDRVGIMVFDRATRTRLRLSPNPASLAYQFDNVIDGESFNGGTDINRGLLDAAAYIGREGRKGARRAIVILTDDQTERDRDEARVARALANADAVLMALIAPDAMGNYGGAYPGRYPRGGGGGGYPGGGYPGGGYPGGGGIGGGLGGIIFGGPRFPGRYPGGGYPGGGGGNYPGGVIYGGRTRSAGTSEIARLSGGDSVNVDDAGALEDTLQRIRQRYALYFYLPQNASAGQEREIEVALTAAARQRHRGAEVRYRQRYLAPGAGGGADPVDAEPVVVSESIPPAQDAKAGDPDSGGAGLPRRRRPAVDDASTGARGPISDRSGWPSAETGRSRTSDTRPPDPASGGDSSLNGGWRKSTDAGVPSAPAAPAQPREPSAPAGPGEQKGGWRRIKPGEQP